MVAWSLILPLAKLVVPLPRLARLMNVDHSSGRDRSREAAVVSLAAWVFKSRPPSSRDNCLERALVTYRYLCRAGASPELVLGVARTDEGVRGHAWVLVDGRPVHDTAATLKGFDPILCFKSDGAMVKPGAPPETAPRSRGPGQS